MGASAGGGVTGGVASAVEPRVGAGVRCSGADVVERACGQADRAPMDPLQSPLIVMGVFLCFPISWCGEQRWGEIDRVALSRLPCLAGRSVFAGPFTIKHPNPTPTPSLSQTLTFL